MAPVRLARAAAPRALQKRARTTHSRRVTLRPQMSRSRSSLLAFNLREFLGSGPLKRIEDREDSLERIEDREDWEAVSDPRPSAPGPVVAVPSAPTTAPPGCVWVDCYFYGFWIEEDKACGSRTRRGTASPSFSPRHSPLAQVASYKRAIETEQPCQIDEADTRSKPVEVC